MKSLFSRLHPAAYLSLLGLLALVASLLQPAISQPPAIVIKLPALPYSGTTTSSGPAFQVTNKGSGPVIVGVNSQRRMTGILGQLYGGVFGVNVPDATKPTLTCYGWLGSLDTGVYGARNLDPNDASVINLGWLGGATAGVYGQNKNGHYGYLATDQGPNANGGAYGQNKNGNFGYLGGVVSGAQGTHSSGNYGHLGVALGGAYGQSAGGNYGYLGNLGGGAYGQNIAGHFGWLGDANEGAFGRNANGNSGTLGDAFGGATGLNANTNFGALGTATEGAGGLNANGNFGRLGTATSGAGGLNAAGHLGLLGTATEGVLGLNANNNLGLLGLGNGGAYGEDPASGNYGYLGLDLQGAQGVNANGNFGSLGQTNAGVFGTQGNAASWAGYFNGRVNVNGNFTATVKMFQIDHPLDPTNKYLIHSCVESDEMLNLYRGKVVTDSKGYATVTVPDWFLALNTDFQYQLTVVDENDASFVMAKIVRKLQGHQFVLRTSQPGIEVHWQVTGARQDAYAKAHPMVVEVDKPDRERGTYLHPLEHGQPESLGTDYAYRHATPRVPFHASSQHTERESVRGLLQRLPRTMSGSLPPTTVQGRLSHSPTQTPLSHTPAER